MQSTACLQSLYHNFKEIEQSKVTVLYKTTNEHFGAGYKKAIKSFSAKDNLTWITETNFKEQTIDITTSTSAPLTMYLVDDIIFTAPFSLQDKPVQLLDRPALLTVSLRLHKGITSCFATAQRSKLPLFVKENVWNWRKAEGDWGYPMSIDGNIYRTNLMTSIIHRIDYQNPNSFEAALDNIKGSSIIPCYSVCYEQLPRLINVPANKVQNVFNNRCLDSWTVKNLNDKFLSGTEIDIQPYQSIKPPTVHVPVDYKFKTKAEHQ